jgi:ribosomal protein S18 acetylase RimI-like enzyme
MGTHRDHQRQGHARRVLLASFAALRRLGASGVHLFADRDNPGAIATYHAAGFQVIGYDTEMVYPAMRGQP